MEKREIKFRALRDDMSNFNWVYGNLIYDGDIPRIQEDNSACLFTTCVKGTEGQLVGEQNKNGTDIYDGDILQKFKDCPFLVDFRKHETSTPAHGGSSDYVFLGYMTTHGYGAPYSECEIVGNIHQNKDLLK